MGKKEFTKKLTPEGDDRLRVKISVDKGEVVDIVVQFETKIRDKWVPIVRYDCSHGFFHRDVMNPKGEKTKQFIAINNLKDALTYAEQDIKDRWEWYKEKFMKKVKP